MATHTLAIDLAAGHVSAISVHSTLRTLQVSGIVAAAAEATEIGEIVDSQSWDRTIATLPASAAYFRLLELPFRDRRRLAQAVGPMLEEHVPVSLDEAVTSFDAATTGPAISTLAAMARKSAITARLGELEQIGVVPDFLVWQPSAVLAAYRAALSIESATLIIDIGIDSTLVARLNENGLIGLLVVSAMQDPGFERDVRWAVRTLEADSDRIVVGGALYESARDRLTNALEGVSFETLPEVCPIPGAEQAEGVWRTLTSAVGLVLISSREAEAPILSFAAGVSSADDVSTLRRDALRTLAPWAATALILFGAAAAVDYVRLYRTAARLDKAVERVFTTAMPGIPGGSGRRTKMELRLQELEQKHAEASGSGQDGGVVTTLVKLSRSIPADFGVEFETFSYDPPNVRMRGHGASFEIVTKLQETLRQAGDLGVIDVGDVRSSPTGDGVNFELSIRLDRKS